MSADSRTTNVWSPVNQHRPYRKFTHRPSLSLSAAHRAASARSAGQAGSLLIRPQHIICIMLSLKNPKCFSIRFVYAEGEAASTLTRGLHNTFNLESFTPDVTSNWFLSHFNITHQNTESSPVRPQKQHIYSFNIKNQQIFSSHWMNCKLCVSELLSSCWAKVKKSRSAVTGSDWLSGRGPPRSLTAALEHADVQSMWCTRPLSPLTSIENMPKTFCCFCTGISNVLFFFPCPFLYFSLFLLVFFEQRQAC